MKISLRSIIPALNYAKDNVFVKVTEAWRCESTKPHHAKRKNKISGINTLWLVTSLLLVLNSICGENLAQQKNRQQLIKGTVLREITLPSLDNIAHIGQGWSGTVIGISDQSFAGWQVVIGDADNDGKNEIAIATGKGSRRVRGISYIAVMKRSEGLGSKDQER